MYGCLDNYTHSQNNHTPFQNLQKSLIRRYTDTPPVGITTFFEIITKRTIWNNRIKTIGKISRKRSNEQ